MVDDRDEKRITLRVSPALYEQIAAAAKDKNMSVNGFIITTMESALNTADFHRRLDAVEQWIKELKATD